MLPSPLAPPPPATGIFQLPDHAGAPPPSHIRPEELVCLDMAKLARFGSWPALAQDLRRSTARSHHALH